jgi:hypothetical protein
MCRPRLAALPLLLLGTACQLDLGPSPFLCNNGSPTCPEGYACLAVGKQQLCVREGSTPPTLTDGRRDRSITDATIPDGRPRAERSRPPDGPRPADGPLPPKDGPPGSVQIAITELMINPKAITDADGEWIELFNLGTQAVDINGWTLKDLGTDLHVIAAGGPLLVPAKGYLVLGKTTDMVKNGGVKVAYAYDNFFLANSSDEVLLLDASGKTIDSVTYTAGWTIPDGASLSVKNPTLPKSNFSNWCEEPSVWAGSKGDKGTPGANPGC